MKNIRLILFVTISTLYSSLTQALPIINADAFSAGDGKAIRELSTGLIWLDCGINHKKSFNEIKSSLDDPYTEWRLPTETEVLGLWNNLFGMFDEWEVDPDGYGRIDPNDAYLKYIEDIFDIFMQEEHMPDYLEGRFITDTGVASGLITADGSIIFRGDRFGGDDVRYEASTLLVKKTGSIVSEPPLLPTLIAAMFFLAYVRRSGEH